MPRRNEIRKSQSEHAHPPARDTCANLMASLDEEQFKKLLDRTIEHSHQSKKAIDEENSDERTPLVEQLFQRELSEVEDKMQAERHNRNKRHNFAHSPSPDRRAPVGTNLELEFIDDNDFERNTDIEMQDLSHVQPRNYVQGNIETHVHEIDETSEVEHAIDSIRDMETEYGGEKKCSLWPPHQRGLPYSLPRDVIGTDEAPRLTASGAPLCGFDVPPTITGFNNHRRFQEPTHVINNNRGPNNVYAIQNAQYVPGAQKENESEGAQKLRRKKKKEPENKIFAPDLFAEGYMGHKDVEELLVILGEDKIDKNQNKPATKKGQGAGDKAAKKDENKKRNKLKEAKEGGKAASIDLPLAKNIAGGKKGGLAAATAQAIINNNNNNNDEVASLPVESVTTEKSGLVNNEQVVSSVVASEKEEVLSTVPSSDIVNGEAAAAEAETTSVDDKENTAVVVETPREKGGKNAKNKAVEEKSGVKAAAVSAKIGNNQSGRATEGSSASVEEDEFLSADEGQIESAVTTAAPSRYASVADTPLASDVMLDGGNFLADDDDVIGQIKRTEQRDEDFIPVTKTKKAGKDGSNSARRNGSLTTPPMPPSIASPSATSVSPAAFPERRSSIGATPNNNLIKTRHSSCIADFIDDVTIHKPSHTHSSRQWMTSTGKTKKGNNGGKGSANRFEDGKLQAAYSEQMAIVTPTPQFSYADAAKRTGECSPNGQASPSAATVKMNDHHVTNGGASTGGAALASCSSSSIGSMSPTPSESVAMLANVAGNVAGSSASPLLLKSPDSATFSAGGDSPAKLPSLNGYHNSHDDEDHHQNADNEADRRNNNSNVVAKKNSAGKGPAAEMDCDQEAPPKLPAMKAPSVQQKGKKNKGAAASASTTKASVEEEGVVLNGGNPDGKKKGGNPKTSTGPAGPTATVKTEKFDVALDNEVLPAATTSAAAAAQPPPTSSAASGAGPSTSSANVLPSTSLGYSFFYDEEEARAQEKLKMEQPDEEGTPACADAVKQEPAGSAESDQESMQCDGSAMVLQLGARTVTLMGTAPGGGQQQAQLSDRDAVILNHLAEQWKRFCSGTQPVRYELQKPRSSAAS